MGYIKADDIAGYSVNNGQDLVCFECIEQSELDDLTQDQILMDEEKSEEDYYFCDRCKKRI